VAVFFSEAKKAAVTSAAKNLKKTFIGPHVAPLGHVQNPYRTPGARSLAEQSVVTAPVRQGNAGVEFTEMARLPPPRTSRHTPQMLAEAYNAGKADALVNVNVIVDAAYAAGRKSAVAEGSLVIGSEVGPALVTAANKVGVAADAVTGFVEGSTKIFTIKNFVGFVATTGSAYVIAHPEVVVQLYNNGSNFVSQHLPGMSSPGTNPLPDPQAVPKK